MLNEPFEGQVLEKTVAVAWGAVKGLNADNHEEGGGSCQPVCTPIMEIQMEKKMEMKWKPYVPLRGIQGLYWGNHFPWFHEAIIQFDIDVASLRGTSASSVTCCYGNANRNEDHGCCCTRSCRQAHIKRTNNVMIYLTTPGPQCRPPNTIINL